MKKNKMWSFWKGVGLMFKTFGVKPFLLSQQESALLNRDNLDEPLSHT
jgi:hypothetical protein